MFGHCSGAKNAAALSLICLNVPIGLLIKVRLSPGLKATIKLRVGVPRIDLAILKAGLVCLMPIFIKSGRGPPKHDVKKGDLPFFRNGVGSIFRSGGHPVSGCPFDVQSGQIRTRFFAACHTFAERRRQFISDPRYGNIICALDLFASPSLLATNLLDIEARRREVLLKMD